MTTRAITTLSLALIGALSGCASAQTNTNITGAPATSAASAYVRNVILFLGDGMGVSTVTAARIYAGQAAGGSGEEYELSFESFPNVALVKTYNTDSQVPDSAGTMSAIMTGEKTRVGFISVAGSVSRNDCARALENELPTLLEMAEDAGYSTGVISTARITHATPAAAYAHAPNRDWEADSNLPATAVSDGCRDIARQLVEFDHGDGIELALGGGRQYFLPEEMPDPEYAEVKGVRKDQQDLMTRWQTERNGHLIWNQQQFDALPDDDKPVLGLFEPSHMKFEADRLKDSAGEPSLAEMTRFAVARLQRLEQLKNLKGESGYLLIIEGGRIDHGHHAGNAYRALTDAVEFAEAVQVAMDLTASEDTQILVTADHSHTFTIAGYPRRGNPILGKVTTPLGELAKDANGRPYTTLGYANGPGFNSDHPDLSDVDTEDPNYQQAAAVPMGSETHGGEDVAAYARGPNADTLRGVIEQDQLFQVLKGALFPGGEPSEN
jgi:alkaline phosphatase